MPANVLILPADFYSFLTFLNSRTPMSEAFHAILLLSTSLHTRWTSGKPMESWCKKWRMNPNPRLWLQTNKPSHNMYMCMHQGMYGLHPVGIMYRWNALILVCTLAGWPLLGTHNDLTHRLGLGWSQPSANGFGWSGILEWGAIMQERPLIWRWGRTRTAMPVTSCAFFRNE